MKKIHQLLVLYIYLYCKKVIFTHCESSKNVMKTFHLSKFCSIPKGKRLIWNEKYFSRLGR